jgi:hypothetical protein
MMRASLLAFVVGACAFAQASSAQVFYEPVQPAKEDYYYGKNDPRTFFFQYRLEQYEEFGHPGLQPYIGGGFETELFNNPRRLPLEPRPFARVDLPVPGGEPLRGWTPGAWPDPNAGGTALYFRKSDLMNAGEKQADGSVIVRSRPSYATVPQAAGAQTAAAPTTRPTASPRIIVIPKKRPAAPAEQSDKLVAVAR